MFNKPLTNKFGNKGSLWVKLRSDIFHFLEIFICFEKWDGKKIPQMPIFLRTEKGKHFKKKKTLIMLTAFSLEDLSIFKE